MLGWAVVGRPMAVCSVRGGVGAGVVGVVGGVAVVLAVVGWVVL